VPGRISEEARRSQQPITESGRSIIDGSCEMIKAAKSLAVNPRDPPTWQVLANHSKSVSDSIKKLVASIRDKAPGQRECDDAIERFNAKIRDLDRASLEAVSQGLRPRRELTAQAYSEQTEASASEILDRLEPLRSAAKFEAEKIGHAVSTIFRWQIFYYSNVKYALIGESSCTICRTFSEWGHWCCLQHDPLQATNGPSGPSQNCRRECSAAGILHQRRWWKSQGE
jgi:hypothetical protein